MRGCHVPLCSAQMSKQALTRHGEEENWEKVMQWDVKPQARLHNAMSIYLQEQNSTPAFDNIP